MKNLTLVIPAKNEDYSLPLVLSEIEKLKCKKIVVVHKTDIKTINSIKKFKCRIIKQRVSGYGNAIIQGINCVETKYLCIFNADGSFDPKYLNLMLKKIKDKYHFIFASRYLTNGGSDDDTMLTFLGNKIFTLLGNILFNLKLSDILFTFVLGETIKFKKLNLKSDDFTLCTEIPIKIKKNKFKYNSIPSYERSRLGGNKKVNEFIDGSLILISLLKFFFNKND
jgi:glycosyltransferase involved in cell wall biosynthesis